MGVNSLPKTVTRQRRDCDLNPGPSAPESSTLTTRLPSHPGCICIDTKWTCALSNSPGGSTGAESEVCDCLVANGLVTRHCWKRLRAGAGGTRLDLIQLRSSWPPRGRKLSNSSVSSGLGLDLQVLRNLQARQDRSLLQEALLPQTDRTTRYVSQNLCQL